MAIRGRNDLDERAARSAARLAIDRRSRSRVSSDSGVSWRSGSASCRSLLTFGMGLSCSRCKDAGQLRTAFGQMPPNGDGANAQQRRNRWDRQSFELVHHDNGTTTGSERVERTPHRRSGDERRASRRLLSVMAAGSAADVIALGGTALFATRRGGYSRARARATLPLSQPRRHGRSRAQRFEECLLHEVERFVSRRERRARR